MRASSEYRPLLLESLKDPKEAETYLCAALEQGDRKMFLIALRNVAEAPRRYRKIAAKSRLNRESLYRMLGSRGNPSLRSLTVLLKSLGFRLSIARNAA